MSATGFALPNGSVNVDEDGYTVNSDLLAAKLGLSEAELHEAMISGYVYSLAERGEGSDAGSVRLTFRYRNREFAIHFDVDGRAWEIGPPPVTQPRLFQLAKDTVRI